MNSTFYITVVQIIVYMPSLQCVCPVCSAHVQSTVRMFCLQCICPVYSAHVQSTCPVYSVHVQATVRMSSLQCACAVYNAHFRSTVYMPRLQCTFPVYSVHVQTIVLLFLSLNCDTYMRPPRCMSLRGVDQWWCGWHIGLKSKDCEFHPPRNTINSPSDWSINTRFPCMDAIHLACKRTRNTSVIMNGILDLALSSKKYIDEYWRLLLFHPYFQFPSVWK